MGVQISELLVKKEVELEELSGKIIAVDTSLFLYQFLSTIRQPDGTPLKDSKGNITSHLTGLFSRTANLMTKGIKLVYVFDGKPPELKLKERERRSQAKSEAERKYKIAVEKEDVEEMKKYAARTSRLTPEMVREAKELIAAFGLPMVQAPSEGEAQASHIVRKGDAYGVASQDADCFLFGSLRLVRNLSISGRKKIPGKMGYKIIKPEIVDLSENLTNLGISHKQLIALGMLVGTDYNPGGVKGIGPKNALKLVKEHGDDLEKLFQAVKWEEHCDIDWREIFNMFENIPVTDDYSLEWKNVDADKIKELLIDQHDFSAERVNSSIEKLLSQKGKKAQKGLGDFF